MTIQKKSYYIALLCILIIAFVIIIHTMISNEFKRFSVIEKHLTSLRDNHIILNTLTSDYLLTFSPRAKNQWLIKSNQLDKQIESLPEPVSILLQNTMLTKKQQDMNNLFEHLSTFYERHKSLEKLSAKDQLLINELSAHLFITSREMVDQINALTIPKSLELQNTRKKLQYLATIVFLLMLVIIFTLLFWINRGILTPLIALKKGTEKIVRGNYDIALELKGHSDDEIFSLSKSFEFMTQAIQEKITYLKDTEERYRAIVEDMPALVCRFNANGSLTFVNSGYCEYLGKKASELLGQDFFQLTPQEDHKKVRNHYASLTIGDPTSTYEHQVTSPTGETRWQEWTDHALFDEHGTLLEFQSIGRDITEKKLAAKEKIKLEEQLQQAHKMEAIGTLAGGIAHDFNNILAALLGYAEMALEDTPESSPAHEPLEGVLKAGSRAKDLVNHILAFSRKSHPGRSPIQMHLIVKEVLELLRASLPTTIQIKQRVKASGTILADPTQIHQIIMNICTNAAQAMDKEGGTLTVALSTAKLTENDLAGEPHLKAGRYTHLQIDDTGSGISQEIIDRIFEPFFTTKEVGKGSGMGLSVVHGIIKNHQGMISVTSTPNKGTTFHVYFPLVNITPQTKNQQSTPLPTGSEHILLIDDESEITRLYKRKIEKLGYQVTALTSSQEALKLFSSQKDNVDMVITDQTMPGMTGDQLAQQMLTIKPSIPIVLCSGYSSKIDSKSAQAIGVKVFLQKPISGKVLAETIRNVLDHKINEEQYGK